MPLLEVVMGAVLSRHADVITALHAPEQFSNQVSSHLNVPNGMDAPEHTVYRQLIEPFFGPAALQAFVQPLQQVIESLFTPLQGESQPVEVLARLGHPFALRAQCAFMGWPNEVANQLQHWIQAQQQAAKTHDRK